ncbi:DUF7824 domain-containing protein [Kitasatospora griseola]|uniref:DUF7824 domain-containing protein n=1 Tax=Kitasatospora griseola TaxID=2064 RepID=UPI0019A5AD6C|nr:DUF6493 family protein [Kitasatospora griseola]GGR04503.1 hypothetical protein GCM10010195_70000 [Kitasatospora griseola]
MTVIERVRAGDADGVARELAGLTPAQRRDCIAELKEVRREVDEKPWLKREVLQALMVAGAGCHTATAAAAWLSTGGPWSRQDDSWDQPALLTVIESRPPEWRSTLVAALARRRATSWGTKTYLLLEHLVRTTGCDVPTTDGFVTRWCLGRTWTYSSHRNAIVVAAGATLWERLSKDPFVPLLTPRLFELDEIGAVLDGPRDEQCPEDWWPTCLIRLAEQGTLDRGELIDRCLARLARGGRTSDQRGFLKLLQAFAPTPEERMARARSYLTLLDALPFVAAHAQQVLAGLDEAGLLPPGLLAEASAAVLLRSEKKLVRSQLGWLDGAARRDPARADEVVLATAHAFGHPDPDLQGRALGVTARHLPRAGAAVLPQLRAAAELLNPAHTARAGELLGGELPAPAEAYRELLPPVPMPVPVPGPLDSPEEVAEELAAVLVGDPDAIAFERVLDGLVRHAHRDRPALTRSLEPVLRAHEWSGTHRFADCSPQAVLHVALAAAGRTTPDPLRGGCSTVFGNVLAGRLEEAADGIRSGRTPFLLATPTSATGTLDAATLVDRLAAYEAAGLEPGPADLSQALLRAMPTEDAEVLAAAERLGSPVGQRAARWLRSGGLPAQPSTRRRFTPAQDLVGGGRVYEFEGVVLTVIDQPGAGSAKQCGGADDRLTPEFAELVGPLVHSGLRTTRYRYSTPSRHWLAALPNHREELAARMLDAFAHTDGRGAARLLPHLIEADGPAGPAVHLAVGYGLGARWPEDRTAAVDALLLLAARGDLDGPLLGRELAELLLIGAVKANRLTDALRAVAATGAYGTVWSALAAALPQLLTTVPARGTGELLAVAADCARRSGARGPIAEVSAAAERGGASRVVKEARALREVLAGESTGG